MPNLQIRVVMLPLVIFLSFVSILISVAAAQDSLGGASLIFISRPASPPVRHTVREKSTQATKPDPAIKSPTGKEKTVGGDDDNLSDGVEDALELGNSARDAEPPRYQDAEKAYRLAAKLDNHDPRPYLGLANLWYDQKNYEAAAKMYREATDRMTQRKTTILGGFGKIIGDNTNRLSLMETAQAHEYLANALVRAGLFTEAETELRQATTVNSSNAQLYALLGYSFFQQKKFAEASEALKRAVQLSPENQAYKQLLEESERQRGQPHP